MATQVMEPIMPQLEAGPEFTKAQEALGRRYYKAFLLQCDQDEITPTIPALMTWDAEKNQDRIKLLFGSDEEIYRAGLQALYSRFFYSYSRLTVKLPGGKSVRMNYIRRAGEGQNNLADLSSKRTTKAQLEFIRATAVNEVKQAALRLKVLNLGKTEIRALFVAAIEEVFA